MKILVRTVITALVLALLPVTAAIIMPAGADDGGSEPLLPRLERPAKHFPRLGSSLQQLVQAVEKGEGPAVAHKFNLDFKDEQVRVIIEGKPGQAAAASALVRSLGADIEIEQGTRIQAMVPASALTALAGSNAVQMVRQPFLSTTLAVSEGVGLINADDWHSMGYDGTGIKVGILDLGFAGYTALLGTDLPDSVSTWWAPTVGGPGDIDHGVSCAEIVHDVAPGAQLYLANYSSELEYYQAIDWMISNGVNIISHSCGNYYGPGDGTGISCIGVNNARSSGITWAQSAGNQAKRHWMGTYNDINGDDWTEFTAGDNANTFTVAPFETIYAALRWRDTWGASNNDYDLYLWYMGGSQPQLVAASRNEQNGDDIPYEDIYITLSMGGTYALGISKWSGTGSPVMDLMTYRQDLEYSTAAGSLLIPADSANAITTGAVAADAPTVIMNYSSRGPTTDNRVKPDMVGPTNVSNATTGSIFTGTSAAAPHVAGAAALVKQWSPAMTPAQIQSYLESNAVPLGSTDKNNTFGSGRLSLPVLFPPSSLTATPVSSTRIDLTWQDNSSGEAGFKIERRKGTGAFAQIATVGAGVTSYTNSSGLAAGTEYTYRVRAYLGTVNSAYSNEATATTLPPPPAAPTLLAPGSGSVSPTLTPTLNWNEPTTAVTYNLQVSPISNFSTTVISQTGLSSSDFTIPSGLAWNKTYYWRTSATNSYNSTSRWSAIRSFKTAIGPPPDAPTGLTPAVQSSTRIDLTWQDNSANEAGFKIERKKGTGAFVQIATVGAGVTSYTNTNLTANTEYTYRVRAYLSTLFSAYSNEATATTLPLPPSAPTPLSPASGSTSATLTPTLDWNEPATAVSYAVQVSTVYNFATTLISQSGLTESSFTISSGLTWNKTYYWRTSATNSYNSTSRWSAIRSFKTAIGPPPDAPTGLTPAVQSSTRIDLTWQDNSANEAGFKIERKKGTGTFAQIATVGAGVTSYTNSSGLTANTEYTYRVRAYLSSLNSAYSNEATATTLPPPPSAPALLSPASSSTVATLTPTLDWNNPLTAVNYRVQVSTVSNFTTTLIDQSGLTESSFTIPSGLAWNKLYYWRANASNSSGSTSGWSAIRNFRTVP